SRTCPLFRQSIRCCTPLFSSATSIRTMVCRAKMFSWTYRQNVSGIPMSNRSVHDREKISPHQLASTTSVGEAFIAIRRKFHLPSRKWWRGVPFNWVNIDHRRYYFDFVPHRVVNDGGVEWS